MDYLTTLTSRSLILFPSPSSLLSPALLATASPSSSPSTPAITLPTPTPIAIPLSNLITSDTHLFFFLLHHVLGAAYGTATTRAETQEAEVMVWRELDKAAVFMRELGMAAGQGDLREGGLKALARRCGLVLGEQIVHDEGYSDHRRGSGSTVKEFGTDFASGASEGSVVMA